MKVNPFFLTKNRIPSCLLSLVFLIGLVAVSKAQTQPPMNAYLFTYFTGNTGDEESIRFAVSTDGLNFRALHNNRPILNSAVISSTGGVRDPHILRGADGKTFYMVATDMVSAKGWSSNRAMIFLKSKDLIHWTSSIINIQKRFAGQEHLQRVWAPQTIYDKVKKKYMVYWSMKHGNDPDKIYYAYANKDFTDLETEPKQLYFSADQGACIDGDIIYHDGKYHLFYKTEGNGAGIKVATSSNLTSGYKLDGGYVQQTKDPVEGAGVFKLNNEPGYILMYDVYTKGKYQFTKTNDFKKFSIIDHDITMDFHPRHGTILPITKAELQRLTAKWYKPVSVITMPQSKLIKKNNIELDTINKTIFLPVDNGTNLKKFDPQFLSWTGISIQPQAPYDFSKGAVNLAIKIGDREENWTVNAGVRNNPVLKGYYADPEIIYAHKTSKYYLYPTSDGFTGWSGNYFKAFSSTNLVDWKDEGIILDLVKSVSWGKRNAWAPTIAEKKVNGEYRYFYYFTAAQKIGVAVAENPVGPFIDSGKPLIARRPAGVRGGQEIDPDVFTDPKTNQSYLYWGNGYMAAAKLNADMISIDTTSIKILTPNASFREGTEVFFRKGTYYFLWSEDDTRSENYRVRYGTSNSPMGPIEIPSNNLILAKRSDLGIYGTGHNSVIQVPNKDEWYIVYHRFTLPKGISMGESAGYNREVCIDALKFNEDGSIIPVVPTTSGISK